VVTAVERVREDVLGQLRDLLPGASDTALGQHLVNAVATQIRPLRQLAEHLREHPDALTSGSPLCPAAWVRLTHELHAAGHVHVVRPGCAACQRVTVALGRVTPAGRICLRCHQRAHPPTREPCGQCGHTAPVVTRAADGSPRCRRCHGRAPVVCLGCGQHRQPRKITSEGGYCAACYTPGHRQCGRCGRVRAIVKRANEDGPDLCDSCNTGRDAFCATCGQQRSCQRVGSGAPICTACRHRTRPPRTCAQCGKSKKVQAIWPIGPVCGACYIHVRRNPVACNRCGLVAPAIGRSPGGQPWCPDCAGVDVDYTCHGCGARGEIYANHLCYRCTLTSHATTLLTAPDGQVPDHLRPLLDALTTVDNPHSALQWLRTGASARLLADLVASGQPVTHELLDDHPASNAIHHLRDLLISAGILPARAEHVARLEGWLHTTLPTLPAHHAQYITPFAHWRVLRRARRRATHDQFRHNAAETARASIRHAMNLLSWLDEQRIPLTGLTQPLLERWVEHVTASDRIRPFLRWLRDRGLIGDVRLPTASRRQPTTLLPEQDRIDQLNRCLHEPTLPLDVRVAGAITLLYGIMIERLIYTTKNDVQDTPHGTFLTLGEHQLLLPPALGRLAQQLRDQRPAQYAVARAGTAPTWLFVGRTTNRPAHPHHLAAKLTRHGIQTHAGRNAARLALAAELPASVLADLTATSLSSATAWTTCAKRDWTDYVAARANTAQQE
jgi:hypothetical protein